MVQTDDQSIDVKGGRELALNTAGKLKAQKFNKNGSEDDFYRWASLRSSYLAEANMDAARSYVAANGWAPGWYGAGWYWDPWFDAYTFIPGAGIFYGPFGWPFYSPYLVYEAPYFEYGFGFGPVVGYGHYYHRFGRGYRPLYGIENRAPRFAGNAHSVVPNGHIGAFNRGAFAGPRGGFGGFHGGGFGGFHGGGRR